MRIVVTMMGTGRVMRDGKEVIFPYRKAEGLFYYLCVKGTVSRDEVIGLLWADCTENVARKNLRDALYHLKKLFGKDMFSVDGNNKITLLTKKIDVIDYNNLTEKTLFEAYNKEEFLHCFYVKNCFEFDEWLSEVREDLKRRFFKAAESRILQATRNENSRQLVDYANILLHNQIAEEFLYREILSGLIKIGSLFEAKDIYNRLSNIIRDEYGAELEESTVSLMKEASFLKVGRSPKASADGGKEYFFCREREMATLLNTLREFHRGLRARSILLSGEAGVGKSTILRKLKDSLNVKDFIIFVNQCVQTEEELYLKPWNDILSQAEEFQRELQIGKGDAPDFYRLDTTLFSTQFEQHIKNVFKALIKCNKNIVIIFDDIQWMDRASKRLLSNLIYWSQDEKLIMILACRDDVQDMLQFKAPLISKGLLHECKISRFSLEETRQIISEYNPDLLSQKGLLREIYENTAGNALFLLEFLKEIDHGGNTRQLTERTTGMIQSRLLTLQRQDRALLEYISLYPRFATLEDIQIFEQRPKVQIISSLERLLSCQLICLSSTYNQNGYGFTHQLIRDYIYNGLLEDKRRMLHSMVAESYDSKFMKTEDKRLYPMLIYHYRSSGDVYKTYTYQLEYLRDFYSVQHEIYPAVFTATGKTDGQIRPLDGKDELVSLAEKIRLLDQETPDVDLLRMKLEFLIGRYDLFSGSFKRGLININISIRLAKKRNDQQYLMENYLQIVYHAIQIHNLKMFNEYLTACEELIDKYSYSDANIFTVMRLRGLYHMKNYQYAKAEKVFHQLIDKLQPLCRIDNNYQVSLAACYNYLGEGSQAVGDIETALKYYLKAIECCDRIFNGLGVFYSNAGYAFYCQGNLEQAKIYIKKANQCFEEQEALWGRSKAKAYEALLSIEQENWQEAQEQYQAALDIAKKERNPSALSFLQHIERLLSKQES